MTLNKNLRQLRKLESTLQQHMALFGYELIDVPIIAAADIFLTRAGDTIIEELFTFERFGQLLALRPEFTAAAAHHYIQSGLTKSVRWQLSGDIFIDEPSDYSRQYQQHNIGAEFIGETSTSTDAEIIAMAAQGMQKLDVSDWQLIIGHVGLQLHLLSQFKLDRRTYRILLTQRDRLKTNGKQAVLTYLSEILELEDTNESMTDSTGVETQQVLDVLLDSTPYGNTMGGRDRRDIAARLLKKHDRGLERQQISDALDFLQSWGELRGTMTEILPAVQRFIANDDLYGQQLFNEWQETLNLLEVYGIPQNKIFIQPDLTKNWDYYTGIVFGIYANETYVASGGRYDGLTQLLGSELAFPAVGFAYYTQKLLDASDSVVSPTKIWTVTSDDPYVLIEWASALRDAAISVQITDNDADITIENNVATLNTKIFSLAELIQELTQ
ncbi:MAG: ATP phosphoribosyltransferase regulatory subunit [Phototrophicaceae bacterium]